MNRRWFIAALSALPFVGKLAAGRTAERLMVHPTGISRVLNVDGSIPETVVPDPYMPMGQAIVSNRILAVNPADVRSWGRPDALVILNGAWFQGWSLT